MFAHALTTRALAVVLGVALGLRFLWVRGAFEALRGDGRLVRHALPHDVAFPPQGDLLQEHDTVITHDDISFHDG